MMRPLTLAIAGDVMLGRLVNTTLSERGHAYPWGDLLPLLRDADLFLLNLECALTRERSRWRGGEGKPFYFRAEPSAVLTLRAARARFASLANNHIGDFGDAGLLETLRTLDGAGIAHAGAGPSLAAARKPACLRAGRGRIAVVAFADYPVEWAATPMSPGINYTPVSLRQADFAPVEQALAGARRRADLVIFSIHWGPNMRPRPTDEFRAFARRVVESGADLFWGHSAHVVQGVEFHRGRPILYDTGDFVDDYAVDEALRNDLSALFLVRVAPPRVESVELLPVRIGDMQVNRAGGSDRDEFLRRLTGLCGEMGTAVTDRPGGAWASLMPAMPAPAAR